ncbi:retrovirus-related pol polyprotein from transposon TNT 1-94, partial [Tanacetum coccineum]
MWGVLWGHIARLVRKGYTQTPRIDYEETFSPIADIRAIRILIAIAAFYDFKIWQMDVKTAFLNGYLSEEVYMEQPEGETNKPTECFEKHLYDSWKKLNGTLFMNRPHGRMILASVEKGPLVWPSNHEDGYQSTVHHNVYSQQPSIPQLEYAPTTYQQQQPEFSQPDSSLVVPVFQKGDDPIDAINHMMSFLTAVVTSRYPTTNNQLRTSSNPRQQATIYDGKVTVQPVQGRQTTYAAGTTRKYTPGASGSNTGKQRTVICYNCKGEGHIAKQCTKPKRKRDETWFNDKVLLVQAQAGGQALTEEEIAFLADPGLPDVQTSQDSNSLMCAPNSVSVLTGAP